MNVRLKLIAGDQSVWPKSYLLNAGSTLIGRADNCSLRLDCSTISGWHCIVDLAPSGVYITDLHSLCGTYVNDRRAIRQPLCHGDVLRLGDLSFLIGVDSDNELTAPAREYALAVAPSWDRYSQAQPQSSLERTSPRPGVPYTPDGSIGQMVRYEKAFVDCTAQLRMLSQKVADLENRLNALSPADQARPVQHLPKKAFEPRDALLYIARAAMHDKVRRQRTSSNSASA